MRLYKILLLASIGCVMSCMSMVCGLPVVLVYRHTSVRIGYVLYLMALSHIHDHHQTPFCSSTRTVAFCESYASRMATCP